MIIISNHRNAIKKSLYDTPVDKLDRRNRNTILKSLKTT